MSQYYLADGNDRRGPFAADQLPAQGLTAETLVWREGLPDWLRADAVPDLAPFLPGQANPQSGYGYAQPQPPQYGYPQQPQYGQQGYGQQGGYPQYAGAPSTGIPIAAMILGILGLVLFWIPVLGILIGVLGLILGIVGMKNPMGKGMSIAGLVCGGIGTVISLAFSIYFFANYQRF